MDTGLGIIAFLVGTSGGLFLLVAILVATPGRVVTRGREAAPDGVLWFGGPSGSEHGAGHTSLILTGRRSPWAGPDVDWARLAETAEPGRRVGGASAGW